VVTEPVFRGVGVALATLFDDGGEVDRAATAAHAVRLVEAGLRAVVVAGSTGEAFTLTVAERAGLLEAVRAAVPRHVPVLAGTGAPSIRQAVELSRDAVDHGADAVLVLSPPGADDVVPYYEAVAAAVGGRPVLAYHYPAVSAPGIPLSVLPDLPVAGCKDSSGDAERLLREVVEWGGHVYTGSSALLSFAGPIGCAGAILALANLEPERCAAAFAGDAGAQRALAAAHVASKPVPLGLKRLMAERFGTSPVARVP